jgi:hypothetical protein
LKEQGYVVIRILEVFLQGSNLGIGLIRRIDFLE